MNDKIFNLYWISCYIYIYHIYFIQYQFFDKPFHIYLFQNICLFQKTNQ